MINFSKYYLKLKTIIIEKLQILKGNKYLQRILPTQSLPNIPTISTETNIYNYNHNLLTIAVNNIYLKNILTTIKKEIMEKYEKESLKLKEISESPKLRHSIQHAKGLRNCEKLVHNLHLVDKALSEVETTQNITKDHIEKVLQLLSIEK